MENSSVKHRTTQAQPEPNGASSRGHGWVDGIDNFSISDVSTFKNKKDAGSIIFREGGSMIFNACGCGAIGGELPTAFSRATGIPSYAAEGTTGPINATGSFRAEGNANAQWYRFGTIQRFKNVKPPFVQKPMGPIINIPKILTK